MKERQRWRPEEDTLLLAYVRQYGAKEWNLISQRMGKQLDRDPKSCHERWKNYLKPGLKKGSLTPEEQTLVISLQAKYGNRWKKIAAEVPGRTAKRLGKWWEVFKENQLKQLQKSRGKNRDLSDGSAVSAVSCGGGSPETSIQGKYDHILETFAEKYVQPKLFGYESLPFPAVMPPVLPPWMTVTAESPPSLTAESPSELNPVHPDVGLHARPAQQMATLVLYCKELEEGKQNWIQQKKEAAWRLNRLEQQLDSEKARKRREQMEEFEAKMKCLREEENDFIERVEIEYREELIAMQRDGEAREAMLMETLANNHLKMAKIIEQIGAVRIHQGFTNVVSRDW